MKIYILYFNAIDDGTTFIKAYSSKMKPKVLASIGNKIIQDEWDAQNTWQISKGFEPNPGPPHSHYGVSEMELCEEWPRKDF